MEPDAADPESMGLLSHRLEQLLLHTEEARSHSPLGVALHLQADDEEDGMVAFAEPGGDDRMA